MPEDSRHLHQAQHNEQLLYEITTLSKQSFFSDWYITISFYTALHYVEAIIFKKRQFSIDKRVYVHGKHSSDFKIPIRTGSEHVVRTTLLYNNQTIFGDISLNYGTLYEMSRVARYDCHDTPNNDYIDAETYLCSIKKTFQSIMK